MADLESEVGARINRRVDVGPVTLGNDLPVVLIAGPCQIESREHAIETAARKIRTGQAQNSGMTAGEFKSLVCSEASGAVDCAKLRVHVQSGDNWDAITPKNCLGSDNNLAAASGSSSDKLSASSGGASKVVLVTACYEWDLATVIPFIELGKMASGASLIQAATTFRTEPYN